MYGLTGNLIVLSKFIDNRNRQYILYHDDEQSIWDRDDFVEGTLKPAAEFKNKCLTFKYGGVYYDMHVNYDYGKLSKEATILSMFYCFRGQYKGHSNAKDDDIFWMKDNTVYRLALTRRDYKVTRERGDLISEVKDFITWNYIIPCHVSISMNGELLHSNTVCSKLLYVDGTFRDDYEKIQFTNKLGKFGKLPDFTLILNLRLRQFDDIIYINPLDMPLMPPQIKDTIAKSENMSASVYTLANITIPEHYQLICPPNSNSIYLVDTDTGEQQLCNIVKHWSFYFMLSDNGFRLAQMPPSLDLKDEYLKEHGITLVRRGLYVQTDVWKCHYVSGYEKSPE
jgi:hypothetical protein